jgi:hypothetical protein
LIRLDASSPRRVRAECALKKLSLVDEAGIRALVEKAVG